MSAFNAVLLCILTTQRSASSILLHEAGHNYSTALAVLLGEVFKLLVCMLVSLFQIQNDADVKIPSTVPTSERQESSAQKYCETIKTFYAMTISKDAWRVLFPAALYVVQNNLYLYASGRLQPSMFQSLWQLRLIPSVYISQILLKKSLARRQWCALIVILAGVIIMQQRQQVVSIPEKSPEYRSKISAMGALLLAAHLASLAGVLLEKLFNEKSTNLWIANFQLSSFSLVPAAFVLVAECAHSATSLELLNTFTQSLWPWVTVLVHGMAGILVALTTKYAGCIAGSIAGIASIALTHSIEIIRGETSTADKEASFFTGLLLVATGAVCHSYFSMRKHEHAEDYVRVAQVDDYTAPQEMASLTITIEGAAEKMDAAGGDQKELHYDAPLLRVSTMLRKLGLLNDDRLSYDRYVEK